MRIVGGKYKGRTLCEFLGEEIRPTSDKVRESIFNILQFRIYNSSFLDLCSGTGAMGIEALSRGAKNVVFNDFSKKSLALLKQNLEKLKITDGYKISNFDAVNYLKNCSEKFDIIFIDPPYKSDIKKECLAFSCLALEDDGIVILEDENDCEYEIENLILYDKRKYGRIHLSFFKKETK